MELEKDNKYLSSYPRYYYMVASVIKFPPAHI